MTPLLTDTGLAAALERHPVEYWRTVSRYLPDAELHDEGDATWLATSVPFFPFNQVLCASLAEDTDAAIGALLARFRARRLPFCWNLGPSARPAGLAARLEARRPTRSSSMPGMTLDISAALPSPAPPDGLRIERVRDAAALERWAFAYTHGFGLAPGFVDALAGAYLRIGFDDAAPFRHYVGLLDGEPVACSTMFLDGAVAGLWHIATLPEARRRSIGAALTIAPLGDARDAGYDTAILYASEMGEPLYRRLGFRELLRLHQYGWDFDQDAAT